jgi:hypothetical protein
VRAVENGFLDGIATVTGLCDDLKTTIGSQPCGQSTAHQGVIINNENSYQ